MINNQLKLNNQEIELIKKRYKDIDLENLLFLVEGMSSLTYLDMLQSSIRYDLDHQTFNNVEKSVAENILKKAVYYKEHGGRNYLEGFDIDKYCTKADELAQEAIGCNIENELYRIDQIINYIRSIKIRLQKKDLQRMAIYLGTKMGEIMLEDRLLQMGYDWEFAEKRSYPCITNHQSRMIANPMSFIYKKLLFNNSIDDNMGAVTDFYYNFLDTITNM